jgi:hypothetical protein
MLEDAQLIAYEADPFRKGRPAYYIAVLGPEDPGEPQRVLCLGEALMRRQ